MKDTAANPPCAPLGTLLPSSLPSWKLGWQALCGSKCQHREACLAEADCLRSHGGTTQPTAKDALFVPLPPLSAPSPADRFVNAVFNDGLGYYVLVAVLGIAAAPCFAIAMVLRTLYLEISGQSQHDRDEVAESLAPDDLRDTTGQTSSLSDYGKHCFIEANGMTFHCVVAGPSDGMPILLLHGFPETWYTWRHQLRGLSSKYRVYAVDMRGYGLSSKPEGTKHYTRSAILQDIKSIIQVLGYGKGEIALCAHDWGGIVAWSFAEECPWLVKRLILINTLNPTLFKRNMGLKQLCMSFYMYIVLVFPGISDWVARLNDSYWIYDAFRIFGDGAISVVDMEITRRLFCNPGSIQAAFAYYRNLMLDRWAAPKHVLGKDLAVPTLVIWGEGDLTLDRRTCLAGLGSEAGPVLLASIPDGSHFPHEAKPGLVNQTIDKYLSLE
ncbi:Alpha/Beta hydrolase protein [Polychytrium aggregatum]|uniref:Alpha/Beta hydrolase protein n=1 Tax=Polychytrium aggregatum TaxID=110093 RepID=UPI0022FDDAE9|nr:Alpha/Beta hydrolase protein [Polychytrium aggregatum]KAI9202357.1 Alpha/Beta hydrolase protein [Polychytrium aggregatum]